MYMKLSHSNTEQIHWSETKFSLSELLLQWDSNSSLNQLTYRKMLYILGSGDIFLSALLFLNKLNLQAQTDQNFSCSNAKMPYVLDI